MAQHLLSVGLVLSVAVALSACATPKSPTRATNAPAKVVSADPVLAFVAAAQPGDETSTFAANDGLVTVRVDREYYAASDEVCRRYLVRKSASNIQENHVACRAANGTWKPVVFPKN